MFTSSSSNKFLFDTLGGDYSRGATIRGNAVYSIYTV